MSENPSLSVVIPVYNEQATLKTILKQVLAQPWCTEVIIVDDGSTDGSIAQIAALKDNRVRLVLQKHQGKGAAVVQGVSFAQGSHIVVQDADLEYSPSDIAELWHIAQENPKVCIYGSRLLEHNAQMPWFQVVANKVLSILHNKLFGTQLTDMETGYKLIPSSVFKKITPHLSESGFGFEPQISALLSTSGYTIVEVPVRYQPRTFAEGKKITWLDGVKALFVLSNSKRKQLYGN